MVGDVDAASLVNRLGENRNPSRDWQVHGPISGEKKGAYGAVGQSEGLGGARRARGELSDVLV